MSTPFASAEPVSISSQQQLKQDEPVKETVKEPELPQETQPVLNEYIKVVENPVDVTTLWNFVQIYLTYLESKTHQIIHFFSPDSKNLMVAIKKASIANIDWNIYNCLLTLSNTGTQIAQKEQKSEQEKYYLTHVMLTMGDDSPTWSFTELLQQLQQKSPEVYKQLNDKFMDAFSKYDTSSDKVTIPYCNYQVDKKWIIIAIIFLIFIISISAGGFFYSRNNVIVGRVIPPTSPDMVMSDTDSLISFS